MRWLFMIVNILAMVLLYGAGPQFGFYLAFVLLAANFASFCLLYDEPIKRARNRIQQRLLQLSVKGVHSEEHERLQSMKASTTEEDRAFRLTLTSGINVASGLVGALMLVWALFIRLG